MNDKSSKGPLKGLKILDFTIALAGALTAWEFADLGADVWKIERYGGGDQARDWSPFVNGMSTLYASYNKNKKSIEMDLSKPEGKEIIYQMVKDADVVLENFKSGSMDRLGLGYDKLSELNPKLVYLSLSGFGASGPLMKYPCYDAIAEARSGMAASNGEPGGVPMKVGNCIGDTLSGIFGVNAVLMALLDARKTGKGCRIDISMMDVAMCSCAETLMDYGQSGSTQTRFGDHDRFIAPCGMFEARDGYAVIIADTDVRFQALCRCLGLAELSADQRFATNAGRIENKAELAAAIEQVTKTKFRVQLEKELMAQDVPCTGVLTFIEAYTSDHANKTGLTSFVEQPKIGRIRFYNNPIKINGEQFEIQRGAALLGEDTDEILKSSGYTDAEIQKLYADGVVASHKI